MFCTHCGAKVADSAKFCPRCGAQQLSEVPSPSGKKHQQSKKRRWIITIIAAAVACCIAGAVIAWSASRGGGRITSADRTVDVSVGAPDYDADHSSPIPVRVVGETATGKKIDVVKYASSSKLSMRLAPGRYTLSLKASPLCRQTLYRQSASVKVEVPSSQSSSPRAVTASMKLVKVDLADITDQQIDAAYKAAVQSGMSASQADAIKKQLVENHQQSVQAKQAAQAAAQQKAAEQKAQEELEQKTTKVTGWYAASAVSQSNSYTGDYISSVNLSSNLLTVSGAWHVTSQKPNSFDGAVQQKTLVLRYDSKTQWVSTGGDDGPQPVSAKYVAELASQQDGLGLILHIENGYLTYADIAS